MLAGRVADHRVDLALLGGVPPAGLGADADVRQVDPSLVGHRREPLELREPVPAGVAAVVGLRLQFADDGLGDDHRRALVGPVLDAFGHAAVDDRTGVRYYVHTVAGGACRIRVFDRRPPASL